LAANSNSGNLSTRKQADGQVFYTVAQYLDRLFWTGLFEGRFSDRKVEQDLRQETGPVTGFSAKQGFPW